MLETLGIIPLDPHTHHDHEHESIGFVSPDRRILHALEIGKNYHIIHHEPVEYGATMFVTECLGLFAGVANGFPILTHATVKFNILFLLDFATFSEEKCC